MFQVPLKTSQRRMQGRRMPFLRWTTSCYPLLQKGEQGKGRNSNSKTRRESRKGLEPDQTLTIKPVTKLKEELCRLHASNQPERRRAKMKIQGKGGHFRHSHWPRGPGNTQLGAATEKTEPQVNLH